MTTTDIDGLMHDAEARIAEDHRATRIDVISDDAPVHPDLGATPNSGGRPSWANTRASVST
jgi:hypothetical protein